MLLIAIVVVILSIVLFSRKKSSQQPIFGVYQVPGKWYYLKIAFFYSVIKLRQKFRSSSSTSAVGYGQKSHTSIKSMDCIQQLSSDPKAIDAVYFNAASADGYYLVTGTARRPHGVINGFFLLRIPEIGVLLSPKMPDTQLFQNMETGQGVPVFGAEGIELTPLEPMRKWRIQYNGKMRSAAEPEKMLDVSLDAEWSSSLPYFDFDTDMKPLCLARAIGREVWSREYFQRLKEAHQTHYEQHGDIRGKVTVGGQTYSLNLNSMRDHSYAHKREWKLLHRYGLHMFTLEDGTRACVGIVSEPGILSFLELGYLYTPSGTLVPMDSINLPLYYHGEGGTPPTDYGFSFSAGGREYNVQVHVLESPEFYMGWEWEALVVERLAQFKVDGVHGWGVAEWEYRHHGGRDSKATATDPAWTSIIDKE